MTETFINYNKTYMPGYTGHVPQKSELFGCTAGDINKIVTKTGTKPGDNNVQVAVSKPYANKNDYYVSSQSKDDVNEQLRFGNHSAKGANWIGGPTNNLQSQYIPGYSGHLPGVKGENLYGKSFAKTSSKSIHGEYEKGLKPGCRVFETEDGTEFSKDNYRQLRKDLEPAEVKDIVDAFNFHDAE